MSKAYAHIQTITGINGGMRSQLHSERIGNAERDYFLPESARGSNHFQEFLGLAGLQSQIESNEKNGLKLHGNAQPIKELLFAFSEHHSDQDLIDVSIKFSEKFNQQLLWTAIHHDEGFMNKETGEVDYNRHVHCGISGYNKSTGKMNRMKRDDMRKMQDFFAAELGLERGAGKYRKNKKTGKVEVRKHRDHWQQRKLMEAIDELPSDIKTILKKEINNATGNVDAGFVLKIANTEIRSLMKGQAKQSDYQELKKAKEKADDDNYSLDEKLKEMAQVLVDVQQRNQHLESEVLARTAERDNYKKRAVQVESLSEQLRLEREKTDKKSNEKIELSRYRAISKSPDDLLEKLQEKPKSPTWPAVGDFEEVRVDHGIGTEELAQERATEFVDNLNAFGLIEKQHFEKPSTKLESMGWSITLKIRQCLTGFLEIFERTNQAIYHAKALKFLESDTPENPEVSRKR